MTDKNLTEIAIILDRSGSMQTIREDMIGGYAAFMGAQAALPGRCVVSLYHFDHEFETVYEERPVGDVPRLVLEPRGNTALLDACGRALALIGKRLRKKPDHARPSKVVVLVITDGHENASREYAPEDIRRMFEHQHAKYGWQFAYLGANVDAFAVARDLGIRTSGGYRPTSAGVHAMYGAVGNAVTSYRSGGQALSSQDLDTCDKSDEVKP